MCVLGMVRIDEIFQKESDPFTTNEGMLEVINTIRFRHFDKAVEVCVDIGMFFMFVFGGHRGRLGVSVA